MKLSKSTTEYLFRAIDTALSVNVDYLIISPELTCANCDDSVIILDKDKPELDFGDATIGLTRLSSLDSRRKAIGAPENIDIECKIDDSGEFVRSLKLKLGRMKVDYRCANPAILKSLSTIFGDDAYIIKLDENVCGEMVQAANAMKPDFVTIMYDGDTASVTFADVNNDKFDITLPYGCEKISDEATTNMLFRYPIKPFISILKSIDSDSSFAIRDNGMLTAKINDIPVTLISLV